MSVFLVVFSCSWLHYRVQSLCTQLGALKGLSLFSLLLWASCTNALIMVWWLFVPTSSAGQTCHPFYFAQSWYWSLLSVASFSLLGISVAARENTPLLTYLLHTRHTSYIQTSWKHWYGGAEWWKADALQVNIFAAWHCSEITLAVTGELQKSTEFTKAYLAALVCPTFYFGSGLQSLW